MIARMWRGWAPTKDADQYEAHYRHEVVPELQQIAGFRGAQLSRRTSGDEIEFVSVTLFDDLDAIRAFAGDNFDLAVVADQARGVLVRFDERVTHYDVCVDLRT